MLKSSSILTLTISTNLFTIIITLCVLISHALKLLLTASLLTYAILNDESILRLSTSLITLLTLLVKFLALIQLQPINSLLQFWVNSITKLSSWNLATKKTEKKVKKSLKITKKLKQGFLVNRRHYIIRRIGNTNVCPRHRTKIRSIE